MQFPSLTNRHTITRDLSFGLVITIAFVFALGGTAHYFYALQRDRSALHAKADEITDNLASVLVTPMWNLNTEEIRKIITIYRQSGIVHDITVEDDTGLAIVPTARPVNSNLKRMSRIIRYENQPIGRVTVAFSDAEIVTKQKEIIEYTAAIFALLSFALVGATVILLRRFLNKPLTKLMTSLEVISGGDYDQVLPPVRQAEINRIMDRVMQMAREIAQRETALEQNRHKLEILNQAIMDIFSCSNSDQLIRTTMALTHKICGAKYGLFLPSGPVSDAGEKSSVLVPLILEDGKVVDADATELVALSSEKFPKDRSYGFKIRSRYHVVGEIKLSFDTPPDPSEMSLLKSLMSLASLALIRQSFIRETALMTAELQVAEAVQRSLLPDDSRLPRRALVAYHYEPVLRVGGDWFSILEANGGDSVFVILGDVTGHGLAQGLVTTAVAGALQVVESMVKEQSAGLERSSQIVALLDTVISRIAGQNNLRMTCVAAKLDFKNMTVSVCNAGHTFPVMMRHSLQTTDSAPAIQLEIFTRKQQYMLGESHAQGRQSIYSDADYHLNDDDLLVFYTDGLTEALDREGRQFIRKFHRFFGRMKKVKAASEVRDELISQLREHIGETPIHDDVCLLVIGKRD